MKNYEINVSGCDDHTTIAMALTAKEAELVTSLVSLVNRASTSHCQPTMQISEVKTQ